MGSGSFPGTLAPSPQQERERTSPILFYPPLWAAWGQTLGLLRLWTDTVPVDIICRTGFNLVKEERREHEQSCPPTPPTASAEPRRAWGGAGAQAADSVSSFSADAWKFFFLSQHRYFDTALRFWAFFFFFFKRFLKTSAFTFTISLMVMGGKITLMRTVYPFVLTLSRSGSKSDNKPKELPSHCLSVLKGWSRLQGLVGSGMLALGRAGWWQGVAPGWCWIPPSQQTLLTTETNIISRGEPAFLKSSGW